MTKNEAILKVNTLKGLTVLTLKNTHWSEIVSYRNEDGWWLNVPFEKFEKDLYLILNYSKGGCFFLLTLPANSIKDSENTFRNKDKSADIFIPRSTNIFIDTQSNGTKYQFQNYEIILYDESKDKIIEESIFKSYLEQKIAKSQNDSQEKRLIRLKESNKKPELIEVKSFQYKRNPDVIAEVLNRANGVCERCNNNAPFLRKKDNTPFLEVHHIVTLANGGDDTVENTIAVCPNCHRELHYGRKSNKTE